MKSKATKNIPALISAILAGIAGLFCFVPIAFGYYEVESGGGTIFASAFASVPFISALLGLSVLVLAFVRFNKTLNAILVVAGFVLIGIGGTLLLMVLFDPESWSRDLVLNFVNTFWYTGTFEDTLISLGNVLWLVAAAVAGVSVVVKPRTSALDEAPVLPGQMQQQHNQQPIGYDPQTGAPIYGQPAQAQPVGYDPQTGAPIYGQPAYMRPESPLPLIALLGGILFPLLGIIVGHIALGQMKRGEIPSSNMSLAKTGLILGYVFTALGILAVVVYIALFAAIVGPGLYY